MEDYISTRQVRNIVRHGKTYFRSQQKIDFSFLCTRNPNLNLHTFIITTKVVINHHQVFYNKIQGNKLPKLNNDTFSAKLVHRGLATVLLLGFLHSIYLMYHGRVIQCGEGDADHNPEFYNSACWSLGLHIYANRTEQQDSAVDKDITVHQDLSPGLRGYMEKEENKVHLTKITLIPGFFAFLLLLTYLGRIYWNFQQKNMLSELIGSLDTRKTRTTRTAIPKADDRSDQIKEAYETLMNHLRFYADFAGYYVGSLVLNLIALLTQAYWVISFIGEGDIYFAFNVYENFETDYRKWPVLKLYGLPSVAICHYSSYGKAGNLAPRDFICSLPWNMSFLKFFCILWFLQIACALVTALEIVYWVMFLTVPQFKEYVVRSNLKLHVQSESLRGVKRLNCGTLFILLLLNKNVKTQVVCKLLSRVGKETASNFLLYVNGL